MDAGQPVADWRSATLYESLHRCDRHGFAWEWLRRSPAYRLACAGADPDCRGAARFGLHRFEDTERGAPFVRPIWRADADPWVLVAAARCESPEGDLFDVARLEPVPTCYLGSAGVEHWLFSDGWRQVRLDIVQGSLGCGPAWLDYRIGGLVGALPCLTSLARLVGLARTGRLPLNLFPPERRAHRWVLVLRVHDALVAGASQREIAAHLFGLGPLRRWRVEAHSYRRRVQRLVAAARASAAADPRLWLNGGIG